MVGRRTSSQRGTAKVEPALARRPKRNVSPKTLDISAGLSWREERELKKALYASLQESRRQTGSPDSKHSQQQIELRQPSSICVRSRLLSLPMRTTSTDDSSQDSTKSSVSSRSNLADPRKSSIRAQRKFAQGSLPPTPSSTPVKSTPKPSTVQVFNRRAKTEDFLTFLCLRGTPVLPSHLDFFNFSREEVAGESSCPNTPSGKAGGMTRESSPTSSHTSSSNTQEDTSDLGRASPMIRRLRVHRKISKQYLTPIKKAARACASTPETARGLAGARPGNLRARPGRPHLSSLTDIHKPATKSPRYPPPPKLTPIRDLRHPTGKTKKNAHSMMKKKSFTPIAAKQMEPVKRGRGRPKLVFHQGPPELSPVKFKRKTIADDIKLDYVSDHYVSRKKKVLKPKIKSKRADGSDIIPHKQIIKRKRKKKEDPDYDFQVGSHVWPTKPRKVPRRNSTGHFDNSQKQKHTSKKRKLRNSDKNNDISLHTQKETSKKRKTSLQVSSSDDNMNSEQINFMHTVGPQTRAKKMKSLTLSSTQLAASKKLAQVKKFREKSAKKHKRMVKLMKKRMKDEQNQDSERTLNSGHKSPTSLKKKGKAHAEKMITQIDTFPGTGDASKIVNIPVYYPSGEEFQDPLEYIQKISVPARDFGMCKIVPPASWKLDSKINDEMRFTSQKQFIHKVYKRWGPNEQQTECIRQHLNSIGVTDPFPVIGGLDVDLPRLYRTIQEFGGMHNVTAKKKWIKVADAMKLPKQAQDRGTKLYDTYCKFLLSYSTLSSEEKRKLEHQVISEREKREKSEIEDECIVRGKSMPLSAFSRSARNTMSMWFRDTSTPTTEQVENEYWKIVNDRASHVTVHCGHVNTKTQGSLFPTKRDSSYYRHPWNLNNLTWNRDSLLHYLVPVSGASMPVIHLGMLFTTSCWSTDTHFLPYIQYLHSGADIVWMSVPSNEEEKFQEVMRELVPTLVGGKVRWLREDTVMVPPELLVKKGVSLGRCVQKPHEFVIVFPKTYTSTISCGYNLSESVHYATLDWIPLGWEAAQDLSASYTPELFSMDALLYTIAEDPDIPPQTLAVVMPLLELMVDKELRLREQLYEAGLKTSRPLGDGVYPDTIKQAKSVIQEDHVCDISKKICFLSMVVNENDHSVYCLEQAMIHIQKKRNLKFCKLLYRYSVDELKSLVEEAQLQLDKFSTVSSDIPTDKKKISKKENK